MPTIYRIEDSGESAQRSMDASLAAAVTFDGRKTGTLMPGEYQALLTNAERGRRAAVQNILLGMRKIESPHFTDGKSCSPEDGKVLIQANGQRIQIGERIAIIHVNNWAGGTIQHQVRLEFGGTTDAVFASANVRTIIQRLFLEEAA